MLSTLFFCYEPAWWHCNGTQSLYAAEIKQLNIVTEPIVVIRGQMDTQCGK
jgi:hypothetical protein